MHVSNINASYHRVNNSFASQINETKDKISLICMKIVEPSRMEMEVIENMWWHLQSILYLLTSQNNVGQMGAKTRCLVKMQEITAKAMLKNSRIINKLLIKTGALMEPTGIFDKMSNVITCSTRKFIRTFLVLSALRKWTCNFFKFPYISWNVLKVIFNSWNS